MAIDVKASALDADGKLLTRAAGAPAGITRAALAADPAFTTTFTRTASITSPRHLRRWWEALALAHSTQAVVGVHGDSITLGGYAGGTTSADWRKNGFVSQLRKRAASIYGNVGSGAIKLTSEYDEVTLSGGSTSGTTGPQQQGRQLAVGNTATIAPALACTGFVVAYWSGGGQFSWAVDGGGATTVTPAGGDVIQTTAITGLSDATHSLVLTGVGTAHIAWVRPTYGSAGVVVDRFARSGATIAHIGYQSTPSVNRTRIFDASYKSAAVDLAIIVIGANDYAANTMSPSDFGDILKAATDYISATAGGCSLLLAGPRFDTPSSPPTYPEEDYYAEMSALAVADDHVAFVDLADAWGTYDNVSQADLDFMHDTIHPNALGHASIADLLAGVVLRSQPLI